MFIKLTHGLHAVLNAIVSYIQKWTDDSVPDGTRTLHNFKDGQGKRPAVPLDELNSSNNIVNVKTDSKFEHGSDNVTSSENVLKVELKTELGYGDDNLASKTGIENTVCVPPPVIFEIHNEVPDKIEKVIPVKTQALPGQDFVFQILYVKDYNYIEGDILPVFGSWGNYARISRDGKYLTVNSNADLSVRLILTPAPQDWIPEQPDPSIIQQQGDRMLNTIPRDGAKADYTIEEMKIEDNFYTVSIENQATTFVTNSEFSNGKYYNVGATTNKITIPMTFAEGFDENAVYWKCYDDPKSETPVTGYYPTKDYNEEFGPLPERYRKLQYIYTNDNAYMDLDIKLKTDYKCKALMNVSNRTDSSSIAIFGARNSTNTDWGYDDRFDGAYACYTRYYGYETIGYQRGTKKSYTSNHISSIYGQLCWYYSTGTSFEVQKYDGTVIRRNTVAVAQNIDTDWNCYLFTVNDKGTPYLYGVRGNMYRFEMWDENDNLIMRLIPAKDLYTNYIGFYDIINDKFYYNKRPMASFNGPAFYVWQKEMQTSDHENVLTLNDISPISDYNADINLPEEYYKLFGVYFPEAYIDTNYLLKKDDRVEVIAKADNNTNSGYRVLFGSRTSSSNVDNYFFFTRIGYNNYFAYGKNGGENTSSASVYDTIFKLVTNQTQATWYVDGVQRGQITRSGTGKDSTYTCWIGCGNNANTVDSYNYCTIYSFKVYDVEDNLKLNLVPCIRKSDNEIGFYDTVTNTFLKRKGGNNNLQARTIVPIVKKQLVIDNITKDINIGIIKNPVYDEPFKLEDCIEDEPQNEPKDSLTYTYEITNAKILDYFYVVSTTNNATDYVSVDASYRTANLGNNVTFTLTYKSGYDNYDITCTPDTTATVTVNKAHYITYNELDIPADYTPIKGLCNSNNGQVYIKTGYIPKWNDKIVCYSSISNNYYTYPCYVFGCRNNEGNKSFVFYGRRNYDGYMSYDRCCSVKNIRTLINNELMKITADNNGCECDFAYTKTKINTEMYPIIKPAAPDYNPDITLPSGYTKLGYVGNSATSYGDLGFKLMAHDKVEICGTFYTGNNQYEVIYGARTASGGNHCYCVWTRYSNNNAIYYGRSGSYYTTSFIYNKPIILRTKDGLIGWYNIDNSKIYEVTVSTNLQDTEYNCYIFGLNNANTLSDSYSKANICYFKVWNNDDILIHNFVPALRNEDNKPGFYDIITGNFIVSKTTTNFVYDVIHDEPITTYDNCDYEMYLFNCNHANSRQYSFYGNIYKFTAYDGEGNIKVNLVPVKRLSDNQLGFYDTIRQVFVIPENGTLTESIVPTYKSSMVVTDIPSDTYVTIAKNNNARKNIYLEEGIEDDVFHQQIDQIEYTYDFKNAEIIDWFNTVKYINNATLRCSIAGAVATYYNVPRIGADTRFPVTYNIGVDDDMIEATATAGATVEVTKPIKIVYNHVPDEYITLYGLYNSDSNTYFEIPYNIKATDSIKLYVNDTKNSYTYWIFGADYYSDSTTTSRVLCSRYESSNNMYYHSGNKRVNITGLKDEVIEIDCKPSEITYTNGYDTYHYTLNNTPANCNGYFHVFGTRTTQGYHNSSFYGTIYKFTIYDDNGIKINLIPVKRKADGALGFYDTVQDQFYIPSAGSVSIAAAPKLKGSIRVSNITDDTDLIVTEKTQPTTNIEETDAVSHSYDLEGCSITDYWYWINLNNTTNGELTFTNATYGSVYICRTGNDITLPCTYKSGRSSTDFIVSEGTLTNNGLVLTNVTSDKNITVMLNDYHDPKSDTNDDLNIFTDPDFSGYNQYRVVNGTDLMLTSYTYINSQIAAMSNKQIFEFNVGELDILAFDPANIPGDHIKARIVTSDSNLTEVVQNITVDGKQMYKHTISLRNQIKLENGKVYMFKVRDNTDTGKLIAYAKDTGPLNLVNSNGEYTIEDSDVYFNWNEANKYIVQGNKTIYFELNGIKL